MSDRAAAGTVAHLDFYLDRGCVVVPCRPGTKQLRKGSGDWTAEDSRARREELTGNAAVRNGTGGLLVVDVDAKHGGSLADLVGRFPGIDTNTRTVQTVSVGEHGPGLQLAYTLPDGFVIRPTILDAGDAGPRVEVASWAMLPGSRARGSKGWEPNPPMRVYTLVNDADPVPAPAALLAAVEALVAVEGVKPAAGGVERGTARAQLDFLVAQLARADDGQRNEAWTRYALPIVRQCDALGEDASSVLTMAYEQSGGVDTSWLRAAIRNTLRTAATAPSGARGLGPYALDELTELETWARFAPWPGASGPTDRRVFLAVVRLCLSQGRTETGYGKRNLALCAGVSEEAVEASLKRLEATGRLEVIKTGGFISRRPVFSPGDTTHIFPPLVSRDISINRDMCMGVDALSVVWAVPKTDHGLGLNGRHGHLFDLVCAGLTTARALAEYIGSRSDSLSRALTRLVEVGLLVKTRTSYAPAPNAGELSERLALDFGGAEVCAHRENRYRDEDKEFRQWRDGPQFRWNPSTGEQWWELPDGTQVDESAEAESAEWVELSDEDKAEIERELKEEDERRRWEEEQELLRQVGLPNELG
ncbi:bifunctional DNA primase/polymerase [Nocardia gamkensis]|uniref:bifunctional DNA primase/polymerase n=1 Tax=Nocardia gamkensis TaxID=352869 RepID=UPI0037C80884